MNPYPLRHCIIHNEATIEDQEARGCRLSGSWTLAVVALGIIVSQWVWVLAFIPIAYRNKVTRCCEIIQFLTLFFSTVFDSGHGIAILAI